MSTSLKSLSGRGYVPVDKIMMRQKERKVKNTYEVLKKQEMKKQHHTDEEEKTQKKDMPSLDVYHDPLFDEIAEKTKKRKRGGKDKQPPTKRAKIDEDDEEKDETPKTNTTTTTITTPPTKRNQQFPKKNSNGKGYNKPSPNQPQKADPYNKAKSAYAKKQEEREAKRREIEAHYKQVEENTQKRRRKGKKLNQKSARGQPLMKNLVANLIPKIEQIAK